MSSCKKLILAGYGVVAVCLILFGLVPCILHTDKTYVGQEVFLSEEAYQTFKVDIKERVYKDNLILDTFDVLASEPPIIVHFSVTVPYNYVFPYGISWPDSSILWLSTGLLAILCLSPIVPIYALWR